jgi:hypothetical protein
MAKQPKTKQELLTMANEALNAVQAAHSYASSMGFDPAIQFLATAIQKTKKGVSEVKRINMSAGSRLAGEEVGTPDAPAWPQDEQELPGGQGDKLTPADVDPIEFDLGMEMEKEHTPDEATRQEIVLDHLAEDPAYYSKLKQMEGQGVDVKMFGEMRATKL